MNNLTSFYTDVLDFPTNARTNYYSNSEMSEHFMKQNTSSPCYWMFLRSNTLEQYRFKLKKIIGIQKPTGKVRKRP